METTQRAEITIKESAAKIRKVLRSRFGIKASVRMGTGTARSWIHVDIELPITEDLNLVSQRERERATYDEVRKIIDGMKSRGEIRLGHYYGDMDNTPNDELLIQVNHRV